MSRPVAGWDFTHLAGRMEEDRPPWDFDAMTRDAVRSAAHLLDMGTGGGEQLLRFTDVLPADTTATEGWEPNLPVAREALQPYGVTVVRYDPEATSARMRRMPFPDGRFDLVLNRHEAFVAGEVQRVLSPGGLFLTQQVGGDDAHELHDLFGGSPGYPANLMPILVGQVADAGLEIVQAQDWTGHYRFVDVAALLAYLRLVPWDAPDDFAVDRYAERLLRLHRDTQGSVIRLTMRRFWLRARRG
jgi:SAM-dependent methyltransferase